MSPPPRATIALLLVLAACNGDASEAPPGPVRDPDGVTEARSRFGDGGARFLVWTPPAAEPAAGWPVIVDLHGGGRETDAAASREIASKEISLRIHSPLADRFLWIVPILRVAGHKDAWIVRENALDVIDSIREVRSLARVDDRRVYLSGASMGAGGLATLSWIVPHAFAAYAAAQGYYWNEIAPPETLLGVHYRVVHGANDVEFGRLDLARKFADLCTAAGAEVEMAVVPGLGHAYPAAEVGRSSAFFLEHTSASPTDWDEIRRVLDAKLAALGP